MKVSLKAYFTWILFVFLTGAAQAQVETLDKIVATVNGDIILYSDLKARLGDIEKLAPDAKNASLADRAQLEREVLNLLIQEKLAEAEIERLKINVGKKEVDTAIEGIKKDNGVNDSQFEYVLAQSGKTVEQFREEIKKQLERTRLIDRVLKSKILITEEQVDAYLKSEQGSSKERTRISLIFLPTPGGSSGQQAGAIEKQAREIHDQLQGGADFARMAKAHSKGPAPEDGGDIGYIAAEELAPPLEAAIRGLKVGATSDVVKTPGGYYIVKVTDVEKQALSASDPGARQKARKELQQREMNRKYEEWVRDLESRAFIKISL